MGPYPRPRPPYERAGKRVKRSRFWVYLGFGEIRVYAPRVGVAAGAKPKGYPDFGEIRVLCLSLKK